MNKYYSVLLLLVLLSTESCDRPPLQIVAYVEKEVISVSELNHWMLLEKASVFNHFYREYGTEDSKDFWTTKQGDEIPIEMLKERALEKAKRCKIQQILALEKGVVETTSFDDIINELDEVNAERKSKVNKGEPIYGPVQFTTRTYFSHVFDKMIIELKDELSKDELKPSDEVLMKLEGIEEEEVHDNPGFFIMQYVDNNYDAFIDEIVSNAVVEINEEVYGKLSLE